MVLYTNFYNQTQVNNSTLILSMKKFSLVFWIIVLDISIFFTSMIFGLAEYKIQSELHTNMTLNLFLNYTPFNAVLVFILGILFLFVFTYRIKIIITESDIIVHHMILKITFHKIYYKKKRFKTYVESTNNIKITKIPSPNINGYWIRLRDTTTKITLISFEAHEIDLATKYIHNLNKNAIALDTTVTEIFQINSYGHHKHDR